MKAKLPGAPAPGWSGGLSIPPLMSLLKTMETDVKINRSLPVFRSDEFRILIDEHGMSERMLVRTLEFVVEPATKDSRGKSIVCSRIAGGHHPWSVTLINDEWAWAHVGHFPSLRAVAVECTRGKI